MRYRPEIDGLRAIAVLPVVFFHAGFPGFRGGFLGVDIFFVISGYLITSLILNELAEGTFSFKNFYERRIRRILPALYAVAFVSFCLAFFFLLPGEFTEFCDSVAAMLAFCSNIFFYHSINYFNPTAELSPLLHTWSLSVEEQFYVVFPVVMALLWKYRRNWALPAILLPLAASFYGTGWLHSFSGEAKFYLPWFRAWELFLGAVCAFLHPRLPRMPVAGPLLSMAGLAAVLYALARFDATRAFPGRSLLAPMLGVACIILFTSRAGSPGVAPEHAAASRGSVKRFLDRQGHALRVVHGNNPVGWLLSLPPLVGIGLISYSLYLWHHPLFTYARLSAKKPSPALFCVLTLVSAALAYASWRFVEKPCRDREKVRTRAVFFCAGAASLVLLAAAFGGKRMPFPGAGDDLLVAITERYAYSAVAFREHRKPFDLDDARPKLLVMGDSQARDFFNMVEEAGMFAGFQKRVFSIPVQCQVDFTEGYFDRIREADRKRCAGVTLEKANDFVRHADVVIIGSAWQERILDTLSGTIALLAVAPEAELFLLGGKAITANPRRNVRDYLPMGKAERAEQRTEPNRRISRVSGQVAARFPEKYIDMYALFCGANGKACRFFTEEGDLIFFDGTHLTQNGARYFGDRLATESVLRRYAAPPPGK